MREQRAQVLAGVGTLIGATLLFASTLWLWGPLRWVALGAGGAAVWLAYIRAAGAQLGLARVSLVDPVTGLYNRRHLQRRLQDEAARVTRYGGGFALCVLDIDNFKSYNDRFGHLEGDRRLRQTARVLRQAVRSTDQAFRYGGEEFVLLLPHCAARRGAEVAERALAVLRGTGLTASAGVADFPGAGSEPEAVLAEADAACLRAKATGKDRVVCRSAPESRREAVR